MSLAVEAMKNTLENYKQNMAIERKYLNETISAQDRRIERLENLVSQYENIIETLKLVNKKQVI